MAASRTIIVAGAGIGGLTAALALAAREFRVVLCEQAERLEEVGAGIQLSPNASRVLTGLGLAEKLAPHVVAPQAVSIRLAQSAREIARIAFDDVSFRYGAPYWVIHRGDLQAVLHEAAIANPDIALHLGTQVHDFALHAHGVTAELRHGVTAGNERGIALVGADGVWSTLRTRLGEMPRPQFRNRTAWRALVDAERVREAFRAPIVHLWLGQDAHLVHYPVCGGRRINIVAIVADREQHMRWSTPGRREEVLRLFGPTGWARAARELLEVPDEWLKWSLFDCAPLPSWGRGAMTLIGDAAHPMLPFLAQGAAMAIEDGATLAKCLSEKDEAVATALRRFEHRRRKRTARVQRTARKTGDLYHLGGPLAFARNLTLMALGGEKLRERYDWLYDWRV